MPRDPLTLIFVGIKNSVIALEDRTGAEVWRARLRASDFVTVAWDGEALIAANSGEVYRLDPLSGAIIWHNELKGLGRGFVTLASTRAPKIPTESYVVAAKKKRADDEAAAAAG
ncbi:MAG: PQQ-binding-like beta-propeller repeat protein [Gemmatimonadales bacterium]